MKNGATKEYKFGSKNNWRNWQWNRITERLKVAPREANVIYLAAKDNHDGIAAQRRGFKQANMIAIERDYNAATELKKIGVTTLVCDLEKAVANWGRDRIDVVVADYCSGLSRAVLNTAVRSILNPCFRNCIFAVNLQRGREAWGAGQELFKQASQLNEKHRGKTYAAFLAGLSALFASGENGGMVMDQITKHSKSDGSNSLITERMACNFNSYSSNSDLVFDSVVYLNPSGSWLLEKHHFLQKFNEIVGSEIDFTGPGTFDDWKNFCRNKAENWASAITDRLQPEKNHPCKDSSIIAAKAVRTRRSGIYRN